MGGTVAMSGILALAVVLPVAEAPQAIAAKAGIQAGGKLETKDVVRVYGLGLSEMFGRMAMAEPPPPPPAGSVAISVEFYIRGAGGTELSLSDVEAVTEAGDRAKGVSCEDSRESSITIEQAGWTKACFELPRGTRLKELGIGPLRSPIRDHGPSSYERCTLTLRSAGFFSSVRESDWRGVTVIDAPKGQLIYEVLFDLVRQPGRDLEEFNVPDTELVTSTGERVQQAGWGPGGGMLGRSKFTRGGRNGTLRVRFLGTESLKPATIWIGPSSFDLSALPPPTLAPAPAPAKTQ